MNEAQQFPILAASVCLRRDGEVLLIQRGTDPGKGKWAFPGGKVHWGETTAQAALRELTEETQLIAKIGPLIGLYEVVQPTYQFAIACYLATDPIGILRASSDAAVARWISLSEVNDYNLAANISEALTASFKFIPSR